MTQQPARLRSRSEPLALALLGVGVALLFWLLSARWPDTPDGWIHLQRVRALSEALRMGVLYPRWFPDFGFGYGYPVLHYYAPGFYYPPALLMLAGLPLLVAVRLMLALTTGLAAVAMARTARLFAPLPAALAAGLVYTASTYRLYDWAVRGALPEYAAFLWLPVVAGALVTLLCATRAPKMHLRSLAQPLAAAALAWAALILTHNLTALLALLAALLLGVGLSFYATVIGQRVELGRSWLWNGAALALAALLSAWYTLPALLEARWVAIGGETMTGYTAHFAQWGNLFARRIPFLYPAAAEPTVPLALSLTLLAALAGAALLLHGRGQSRAPLAATLLLLLAALFMTTQASALLWRLGEPVLGRLQFPWRWQAIAAPALALAAALGLARLRTDRPTWLWLGAAGVAILALVDGFGALPLQPAPWLDDPAALTRARMLETDASFGQVGASWTAEFLPVTVTEERWAIGREPPTPSTARPSVALDAELLDAGYLSTSYRVRLADEARLSFQTFHFPAWAVEVDGARVAKEPDGALGLLAVPVPAGEHTLAVNWRATPTVLAGRALAALGWLLLLVLLAGSLRGSVGPARGRRVAAVGAWLAAGALALVAMMGWSERTLPAQPLAADYGAVALAGVVAPPVRVGSTFSPVLHWAVREDAPNLTAFVHLLDSSGAIVAQHDGPLGGAFAPAARLAPGMLLDVTVDLALPAELPAGAYTLRVGLYPPGAPDSPLLPAGSNLPYVQGGQVEVRP